MPWLFPKRSQVSPYFVQPPLAVLALCRLSEPSCSCLDLNPYFLSYHLSCRYSLVRTQRNLSWLPYKRQVCPHVCHPPHCNTFYISYLPLATICKPFRLFTYMLSISPSQVEALVVPEPHCAIHYRILSSRTLIRWEHNQILLNEWTEAEKWQDW